MIDSQYIQDTLHAIRTIASGLRVTLPYFFARSIVVQCTIPALLTVCAGGRLFIFWGWGILSSFTSQLQVAFPR